MPTITGPLNGDFTILFSIGFLTSVFNGMKCVHLCIRMLFFYFESKKMCRLAGQLPCRCNDVSVVPCQYAAVRILANSSNLYILLSTSNLAILISD